MPRLGLPLLTMAQFFVAMALFTWSQPKRDHFARRYALVIVAYLAVTMLSTWVGFFAAPQLMTVHSLITQVLLFSAVAVAWVFIILFCYDTSPVTAIFVGMGGYITQNLGDSLGGVVAVIRSEAMGLWPESVMETVYSAPTALTPDGLFFSVLSTAIAYVFCWHFFARRFTGEWVARPNDGKIVIMFAATLVFAITFDLTIKSVLGLGMTPLQRCILVSVKVLLCVFLLFVEFQILLTSRLEADMMAARQTMMERERQYRISRENIEAINVKCHDIRHQIRSLMQGRENVDPEVLRDIEHEVRVYDSVIETGNEALDTILTEKGLTCEREGITLSVIADGSALNFMRPAELYALFGNALDNAIEAARGIEDRGKRSISLVVNERADMVSAHLENYYAGDLRMGANGLPMTTKRDASQHGFGMRSMQRIAESHGGTLVASARDGVFYLNVLIPIPEG